MCMVKTYGLTHVALAVRDAGRSAEFYAQVFGMIPVYRRPDFIQMQTPGSRDVLVLEQEPERAGAEGGIAHFGYRLTRPEDIEEAAATVEKAGGKITSKGEFVPGEPYVFFRDPDGYEVEIWYEPATSVDPPTPS